MNKATKYKYHAIVAVNKQKEISNLRWLDINLWIACNRHDLEGFLIKHKADTPEGLYYINISQSLIKIGSKSMEKTNIDFWKADKDNIYE